MAASNRSSDDPSAPEPRSAGRPFLGRPATAPLRATISQTAEPPPRISRPFVPGRGTPHAARAAMAAESRAIPPMPAGVDRDAPLAEAATSESGRPTDDSPIADSAWSSSPEIDSAVLAGDEALVPGADAPPRRPTSDVSKRLVAALNASDVTDVETAADAEWLAMSELGDFETPSAERTDGASASSDRFEQGEQQRASVELGAAVVPPADAWPDDVWAEAAAAASEPASLDDDVPHSLTLANDLASGGDNDATLGAISTEPSLTSYPPAVPDSPEAYALDGAANNLAPASAVYAPDQAHQWVDSAGGFAAPGGSIAPAGGDNPAERTAAAVVRGAAAGEGALAARLRQLADEVEDRVLAVDGYTPGLRDSEALVSLLGALLRANR